ncbi:MAG: M28 family peptidase [Candidatus Promineifilaceae bacterium]|nr:M28 family peptidase [Candidatus Promineifilaceae bacterium]
MSDEPLRAKAEAYLHKLCEEIDGRHAGSPGNRAATDFFADVISSFDFSVDRPQFPCLDWREEGAELTVEGEAFDVFPSPYTLGVGVSGPLVIAETVEQIADATLADKILLMCGEMAQEQMMPKNFPFYNPDHHRHLIQTLEAKRPAAIVAATGRDVEMVGDQYPFPLFEDGDFDIPSVYMKDVDGGRLAARAGRTVSLEIRAERIPTTAGNVIARKGAGFERRVTLLAHIDAKMGTPGAVDNAGGIAVLLLLTELLADYAGDLGVEIVAVNGEDYFSNPGEQQFLAHNAGKFEEIVLGINVDGVGYHKGKIAHSLYNCPDGVAALVQQTFADGAHFVAGVPWYQGDHALFLLNQVPALALTSDMVGELMTEIVHTPRDTPALVDSRKLLALARSLHDLLRQLAQESPA